MTVRIQVGPRTVASALAVTTAMAVLVVPGPATAAPSREVTAERVGAAKTALAKALAVSLADKAWAEQVRTALTAGRVDPLALAQRTPGRAASTLRESAAEANRSLLAGKGLPASTGSILELRLAGTGTGPISLVAAEVTDDRATAVPAFDRTGQQRLLSPAEQPAEAVAVVGIDERRALAAGLDVVRTELARHGVSSGDATTRVPAAGAPAVQATAGFWTTRVMSVRLADDEEPWFKGDAEIYSIVSGVGTGGEPRVDIVQMPYLDNDDHWYYPGQILVNWSHFKWNAVDAVMMEEDDGTNYRALAQAIAGALLTILDGVQYAPMVNAILEAMPDSWWTDDPDYVDSWYLLTRQTAEQRHGARGNGVITFAPYFVTAN